MSSCAKSSSAEEGRGAAFAFESPIFAISFTRPMPLQSVPSAGGEGIAHEGKAAFAPSWRHSHFSWRCPPAVFRKSAPPPPPPQPLFTPQQLDQMLAPIALYPDPLLMQMLTAATYPLEVAEAAAWVQDPNNARLTGDALTAAAAEPGLGPERQVARPLPAGAPDDEQQARLAAGGRQCVPGAAAGRHGFGAAPAPGRASGGRPRPGPQESVVVADGAIEIEPANPQMVYMPCYNPGAVYGAWPYADYPPVAFSPWSGCNPGPALGYQLGILVAGASGAGAAGTGAITASHRRQPLRSHRPAPSSTSAAIPGPTIPRTGAGSPMPIPVPVRVSRPGARTRRRPPATPAAFRAPRPRHRDDLAPRLERPAGAPARGARDVSGGRSSRGLRGTRPAAARPAAALARPAVLLPRPSRVRRALLPRPRDVLPPPPRVRRPLLPPPRTRRRQPLPTSTPVLPPAPRRYAASRACSRRGSRHPHLAPHPRLAPHPHPHHALHPHHAPHPHRPDRRDRIHEDRYGSETQIGRGRYAPSEMA